MDDIAPLNREVARVERTDGNPASGRLRWLVMAIGGVLLALLLGSGAVALRFLGEMHAEQQTVTHALATRTQMLSGLWLSIQSYNEAVRQYMTQESADHDRAARQHLDKLTMDIASELKRYPGDRDPTEAALLDGMWEVFSNQRTLYIAVIAPDSGERQRPRKDPGNEHEVSLQRQILDWSGKFQRWSGERIQRADAALVTNFGNAQRGLSQALAIGFGSGLLMVLAGGAYIVRLERQTQSRQLLLMRSQRELQRLSARLQDAQEAERRSISRELHDEIGQALGALLVDIGRLSTTLSGDRPEIRAQLDSMRLVATRTVQAVRNIALLLRPSMLDDLGLVAALEWQGRETSRRSEIEVAVESDDVPDDLPDTYRICIYRLVQEALNNAVRHSGARNAKVTVRRSAICIVVQIKDDGRGFDPDRMRGLGMLGMEERVKRLGGGFTIQSRPGDGAELTAELPFPPAGGEQS